ncbi:MAG: hypothetical protein ABIU95_15540 [Burkholderiales bacterium]
MSGQRFAERAQRAAPAIEVRDDAERDGLLVRLPRAGAMPSRCIACNNPAIHRPMRQRPVYRPVVIGIAAVVLALFGALSPNPMYMVPFLAAAAALGWFSRTRYQVPVGICAKHELRRKLPLHVILGLLAVWAVCGGIAGGALMAGQWKQSMYEIALSLGVLSLFIVIGCAILWFATGVPRLSVTKTDPEHLWLGGAGEPFLESLRQVRPRVVRRLTVVPKTETAAET